MRGNSLIGYCHKPLAPNEALRGLQLEPESERHSVIDHVDGYSSLL